MAFTEELVEFLRVKASDDGQEYVNPNFLAELLVLMYDLLGVDDDMLNDWASDMYSR